MLIFLQKTKIQKNQVMVVGNLKKENFYNNIFFIINLKLLKYIE